jgi:hypothetical protein
MTIECILWYGRSGENLIVIESIAPAFIVRADVGDMTLKFAAFPDRV